MKCKSLNEKHLNNHIESSLRNQLVVGYVSLNEHCKHCVLTKCCSCSYLTLVEAISELRSAKEREVDKLR